MRSTFLRKNSSRAYKELSKLTVKKTQTIQLENGRKTRYPVYLVKDIQMTNKYMKSNTTTCHSGNANEQHAEILEQVIPNIVTKSNVGENGEKPSLIGC